MPDKDDQRLTTHYMVSPHDHTNNFLQNAWGSNRQQLSHGNAMIVPVFKDESQRQRFHERANKELLSKSKRLTQPKFKDDEKTKRDHTILQHLVKHSTGGDNSIARFNLEGIDEHSDVIVQGHGKPGVQSISSDAPKTSAWPKRVQTVENVAQLLHSMKLPDSNHIRANSCHSGTDKYLYTTEPKLEKHFKEGTSGDHHGGTWDKSFAGGLEKELSRLNHHNQVKGYLGSTSQFPKPSKDRQGNTTTNLSVGIKIPSTTDKNRYEKTGMSKINPQTKSTVENVSKIQGLGQDHADRFRAKLLAAHGRHQQGTHKVQEITRANKQTAKVTGMTESQSQTHRAKWSQTLEQLKK